MKYLRKFNTRGDVFMTIKPNVILVEDTGEILYNEEPPRGVFIEHVNGSLYTLENWTAGGFPSSEANGVAVLAEECSFVIAKEQKTNKKGWAVPSDVAIEGVTLTSSSSVSKTDFNGEANTALMLAQTTAGAAHTCANYTFPNGRKGYLPALGEWVVAYRYATDVKAAMTKIDGFVQDWYHNWSSTQYSASKAWWLTMDGGSTGNGLKSTSTAIRPFTKVTALANK
jgi:hypothetical protein